MGAAENFRNSFKEDVLEGLRKHPKELPSKYIYDTEGDLLFQQIMAMPEYYLTRTEYQILEDHKTEICQSFPSSPSFHLLELGAGDGVKTEILLRELLLQGRTFEYIPIDISEHALNELHLNLKRKFPHLPILPKQGMYFEVLNRLGEYSNKPKVILFLGSNIGNLTLNQAQNFLNNLSNLMNKGDQLFIGLDQKKDPDIILSAYNDRAGITAAFNKNLLKRINRELDANFNLENFKHWETYNPVSGTAKSYLVSTKSQSVTLEATGDTFTFKAWEPIFTEISQKFDDAMVQDLLSQSDLSVICHFSDSRDWFRNYLLQKR